MGRHPRVRQVRRRAKAGWRHAASDAEQRPAGPVDDQYLHGLSRLFEGGAAGAALQLRHGLGQRRGSGALCPRREHQSRFPGTTFLRRPGPSLRG